MRWDFLNCLTIKRLITRMSFYEIGNHRLEDMREGNELAILAA